jgi:preprotein translocase subunit SecB
MKPSPLQLERLSIGDLKLKVADRGAASDELEVEVVPTFARDDDTPTRWMVSINIKFGRSDDKPVPYEGQIGCEGMFMIVDESLSEEMQLKLIAVTAPSMLYSAAREIIASLTARAKNGVFLLPSVSFTDQTLVPKDEDESTGSKSPTSTKSTLPSAQSVH